MKLFSAVPAAFLALGIAAAPAADLDSIHASLTALRQTTKDPATRMRPEFLLARDGLRDWIESRLGAFPRQGDGAAFSRELNAELAARDLACTEAKAPGYDRCASPNEFDARGFLGAIEVAHVRDLLVVQAETGVPCGFDETAYIYEWTKTGWRRLLDTAQSARGGLYIAEQIEQVVFTRDESMPADALLLLATGASPSCKGPYRPVHYRVWSAKRGVGATLVVDGRESDAYAARRSPAVSARFEGAELLLEMDVRSLDTSRLSRTAVRRFTFGNSRAARVAPLALTPRDFVEEWLRAPWETAAAWTSPRARESLESVHGDAIANAARARFSAATRRCANEPGAVEVAMRFANGEKYFRLRHDPAGDYQMLAADSAPAAGCAEEDSRLDAPRSVF